MTENIRVLTASHIKYLIALAKLDKSENGVRNVDIASDLSITKTSVHTMMKTLSKLDLVTREKYGVVFLTKKGWALAVKYQKYFEVINRYFLGIFDDGTDIKGAVYAFLAEIPPENMEKLYKKLAEDKLRQYAS